MPDGEVGRHREDGARLHPSPAEQTAFSWDRKARIEADQLQLRALFGAMVRVAGGVDWLAKSLDEKPSYGSKISEGINATGDRKIQLDWLAPMLEDLRAGELLLGWLCERLGFEPPLRSRQVTKEQVLETVAEVIGEMDAIVKDGVRREAARRLGVREQDVKL